MKLTDPAAIRGVIPANSSRPDVYHFLSARLLAEGFHYETATHEWVNDSTGKRGRSCWAHDDSSAWLGMKGDRGAKHYEVFDDEFARAAHEWDHQS